MSKEKTYTTIQGDMWDKIAYRQMGGTLYMDKLIKANIRHAETFVFPAGVVLTIPAVEDEPSIQLPPWQRGILE